jgi:hypothetical protein
MANYFTRFLTGVGEGLLTPKGQSANWRHATKLFIDGNMRLAPRTKFNYYVRFEIDKNVMRVPAFSNKHHDEVGLLVKTAELPKYNFDSVVKNQYNRKKIIYKNFNYEPVNITMHDDATGVISAMWAVYYGYYIADRQLPESAYSETKYRAADTPKDNFRYGMDNDVTAGFFKSVSIYTMARRRFLGYTLINPKIKTWSHGNMDYSASEFAESTMTLEYESVKYSAGQVAYNSPKGFATLHYDSVPSPISVAGGGVATLTGEGGVLDGLEQNDVTAAVSFFTGAGFDSDAAATVAMTLLRQAKIDSTPISQILDTLTGLNKNTLSQLVGEILNNNRVPTSLLGFRTADIKPNQTRNIAA